MSDRHGASFFNRRAERPDRENTVNSRQFRANPGGRVACSPGRAACRAGHAPRVDGARIAWDTSAHAAVDVAHDHVLGHHCGAGMKVEFQLNGVPATVDPPPMKRLLDVLRDDCGGTITRAGCGIGTCGACGVLVDGELVASCLVPVVQVDGAELHLAADDALAKLRRTLGDVPPCDRCMPGLLVAARFFVDARDGLPGETITEALASHHCDCAGFVSIRKAVERSVRRASAPARSTPTRRKPVKKAAPRAVRSARKKKRTPSPTRPAKTRRGRR